jgi:hypothetical protein
VPPPRWATAAFAGLLLGCAMLAGCTEDVQVGPRWQGVGAPCQSDGDCTTGLCYLGTQTGYCTLGCLLEGDTSGCPQDAVCKPIQGGFLGCLAVCGRSSGCEGESCPEDVCPAASSCVSVGSSSLMACEPSPA